MNVAVIQDKEPSTMTGSTLKLFQGPTRSRSNSLVSLSVRDESSSELGFNPNSVQTKSKDDFFKEGLLKIGYNELIRETKKIALSHANAASQMNEEISKPLNEFILRSDRNTKQLVEIGSVCNKNLQDAYVSLKKTKEDYDQVQSTLLTIKSALAKAQGSVAADPKKLEKLQRKYVQAQERSTISGERVQVSEDICKEAQSNVFTQKLPELFDDFRKIEEEKLATVKALLMQFVQIETLEEKTRAEVTTSTLEKVYDYEVGEEMEEWMEKHTSSESSSSDKDASVRNFINPTKAGRLEFKRGKNSTGWKSKYFILVGAEKMLYCFDSEASIKPRETIDLSGCSVEELDESYFGKKNAFQIIFGTSQERRVQFISGENKVYYFIAGSEKEKLEWMSILRFHSFCCPKCTLTFGQVSTSREVLEETGRVILGCKAWIMEAKNLPLGSLDKRALNTYSVVLLDDTKKARTNSVEGAEPFFGEQFNFDDISPCHQRIQIVIFHSNWLAKDEPIGYVVVPLSHLKRQVKKIESWYPIKSFKQTPVIENGPSIRLAFHYSRETVLPVGDYQDFTLLLIESELTCIRILGDLITQREDFAKTVIRVLMSQNHDVEGLQKLISHDISRTEDPNIIFRGNTLTTKTIDWYMKILGSDYLNETLGELIKTVYKSKDSCEMDPSKLERGDDVKRNQKRLMALVQLFWESICRTVDQCPSSLRIVFSEIRQQVMTRFETNNQVQFSAVSGFIFLRFFCAAILSPKLFGLASSFPSPVASRTLTLVTKILQNLANLTEFAGKETYMIPCNDFILTNLDKMKQIIQTISTNNRTLLAPSGQYRIDKAREMETLYQYFDSNIEELTKSTEPRMLKLLLIIQKIKDFHGASDPKKEVEAEEDESNFQECYGGSLPTSRQGFSGSVMANAGSMSLSKMGFGSSPIQSAGVKSVGLYSTGRRKSKSVEDSDVIPSNQMLQEISDTTMSCKTESLLNINSLSESSFPSNESPPSTIPTKFQQPQQPLEPSTGISSRGGSGRSSKRSSLQNFGQLVKDKTTSGSSNHNLNNKRHSTDSLSMSLDNSVKEKSTGSTSFLNTIGTAMSSLRNKTKMRSTLQMDNIGQVPIPPLGPLNRSSSGVSKRYGIENGGPLPARPSSPKSRSGSSPKAIIALSGLNQQVDSQEEFEMAVEEGQVSNENVVDSDSDDDAQIKALGGYSSSTHGSMVLSVLSNKMKNRLSGSFTGLSSLKRN